MATWRYHARVRVHAPAGEVAARLPAAIAVEPVDEETCRVRVGSDSPQLLAAHLGMLDADFHLETADTPELQAYLGTLAARYRRAARTGDS